MTSFSSLLVRRGELLEQVGHSFTPLEDKGNLQYRQRLIESGSEALLSMDCSRFWSLRLAGVDYRVLLIGYSIPISPIIEYSE